MIKDQEKICADLYNNSKIYKSKSTKTAFSIAFNLGVNLMWRCIVNAKWQSVELNPPDEYLIIRDTEGNIAFGRPTYYPFKKIDGEIVPCAPYWDGGFITEGVGLDDQLKGDIAFWATIAVNDDK